ncbi:MAG: DNA polymerase III subunit chi, partial [Algoriphagus sp.]|nr:DNA polymerase III subunit chi [Algoriphagus sp.]
MPGLLEKTLQRGWRAVVQAGSAERLEALDAALWTYSDESFLAHGTATDGYAEDQPIFLTLEPVTPNGAGVRFLVDGADAPDYAT